MDVKTINKWTIKDGVLSGFVNDSDLLRIKTKVTITKENVGEGDHFTSKDKKTVLMLGTEA